MSKKGIIIDLIITLSR